MGKYPSTYDWETPRYEHDTPVIDSEYAISSGSELTHYFILGEPINFCRKDMGDDTVWFYALIDGNYQIFEEGLMGWSRRAMTAEEYQILFELY